MKNRTRWIIAGLLCLVAAWPFILAADFSAQGTYVSDWTCIRPAGAEDGATSAACLNLTTSGNFENKPAAAFNLGRPDLGIYEKNRLVIAIAAGAAADKTFSFVIYGWASFNGPAEFICEGYGITGTQAVVKYPNHATATNIFWADTINLYNSGIWLKGAFVSDNRNNRIAHLTIDMTGLQWIGVFFYDANGLTTEAGTPSAWARWF